MNDDDTEGKICCLECGKLFSFLAPHLRWVHQMNTREYRERWGIPRHIPLVSAAQSRRCRENTLVRIHRGEIVPAEQLLLMEEARKKTGARPPATALQKKASRETALTHRIWMYSPVIRKADDALKNEAVRRMKARAVSGEKVEDISRSLNISVSCLYRWFRSAKA